MNVLQSTGYTVSMMSASGGITFVSGRLSQTASTAYQLRRWWMRRYSAQCALDAVADSAPGPLHDTYVATLLIRPTHSPRRLFADLSMQQSPRPSEPLQFPNTTFRVLHSPYLVLHHWPIMSPGCLCKPSMTMSHLQHMLSADPLHAWRFVTRAQILGANQANPTTDRCSRHRFAV